MASVPSLAADAVLAVSEEMPEGSETVQGYEFNNGIDYHELLKSYKFSGFQAKDLTTLLQLPSQSSSVFVFRASWWKLGI